MSNEYWLYLDDSGKFMDVDCQHVLYGEVLFSNEAKMKKFVRNFKEDLGNISKKDELKGNEFIVKLHSFQRKIDKRGMYEKLLKNYSLTDCNFLVWSCKNDFKIQIEPGMFLDGIKGNELDKLRKNCMIAALIKKVVENNILLDNSQINIVLDHEPLEEFYDSAFNNIMEYLNQKRSSNKNIRYLRKRNIFVKNVEYRDSKDDYCIQASDLIANAGLKKLSKNEKVNLFITLFELYSSIITCNFPKFHYNNNISKLTCRCGPEVK